MAVIWKSGSSGIHEGICDLVPCEVNKEVKVYYAEIPVGKVHIVLDKAHFLYSRKGHNLTFCIILRRPTTIVLISQVKYNITFKPTALGLQNFIQVLLPTNKQVLFNLTV